MQTGDANGDGTVDSRDALWVLWLETGIVASVPQPEAADVNGDGVINSLDAALILQHDVGLLTSLGLGAPPLSMHRLW